MLLSVALFVGYTVIALALIGKLQFFRLPGVSINVLRAIFLSKVLASCALTAIYTYYYTDSVHADIWRYFNDAMVIRDLWNTDRALFWRFFFGYNMQGDDVYKVFSQMTSFTQQYDYGFINNNASMIRCNLVLSLFTGGHYLAHIPWMACMSFCGSLLIFKTIPTNAANRMFILLAMFFVPSHLIWTSSVLKEAPMMLSIGIVWSALWQWSLFPSFRSMLLLLAGYVLILFFRGFVAIALMPVCFFFLFYPVLRKKNIVVPLIYSMAICCIVIVFSSHYFAAGSFLHVLNLKREAFTNEALIAHARSIIELPPSNSYSQMFINFPRTYWNTWFRPLPGDGTQFLLLASTVEDLLLLLGLLLLALRFRKPDPDQLRWIIGAVLITVGLACIIGNTVCVLGAVVRYRSIAVFFLPVAFMMMSDIGSWKKTFTFFRRWHAAS
jgi:hypothetical protein